METLVFVLIILLQVVIIVLAAIVVLFFGLMHATRAYRVPFVPTPVTAADVLNASFALRPGDTLFDLGSGDGRLLCALARSHPNVSFVGIEANPLLVLLARARARSYRLSNVRFMQGNLFTADVRTATHVYTYLLPSFMAELCATYEQHPHITCWISRAFPFPSLPGEMIMLSENAGDHNEHRAYRYRIHARE